MHGTNMKHIDIIRYWIFVAGVPHL